jgi:prevent-host-death family protein
MTMKAEHWSIAGAKQSLSKVIEQAASAPQVIEKRGKPVAVVVSFADYELAVGDSGRGSLRATKWQRFLQKSAELRASGGAVIPVSRREPRPDPFGKAR